MQVGEAQTVVGPGKVQAPIPLQVPLHAASVPTQFLSGSWPLGTEEHVPLAVANAHVLQGPVQELSQQTPSTQNPLVH